MQGHIEIGRKLGFLCRDPVCSGGVFFLPLGQQVYQGLIDMIRQEYRVRGYQEVQCPNLFSRDLWDVSGHSSKYADSMIHSEDRQESLKPMNCPGHCLIVQHMGILSYRQLPLRLAEFGVLHRAEPSGSLNGLFRMRRFCQDDAHIFCSMDQIDSEVDNYLEFMEKIYLKFGLKYRIELSSRPENYIGDISVWDQAEAILSSHIKRFCESRRIENRVDVGGGAFYGPKIDIHIQDNYKRWHQCGSLQLDFNLPSSERFNLKYTDGSDNHQLVMIHRAILGSIERFMGIILEHGNGRLPLFLSPRKLAIIPVKEQHGEVVKSIVRPGVDVHENYGELLNKRIYNVHKLKYNMYIVVGDREVESGSVRLQSRDPDIQDRDVSLEDIGSIAM